VVRLAHFLEREAMRDDVLRTDVPRLHVLEQRLRLRFTLAWFIRSVRPLFIASPIFTALKIGPYAPTMESTPPLRTASIAQCSATAEPPKTLAGRMPKPRCIALPRASQPTASMAASQPSQSVSRLRYQTGSRIERKFSVSHCAKRCANSRR